MWKRVFLSITWVFAGFGFIGAQAMPLIEADAFTVGDNQAVLDTNTGLIWMDFGINQHQSYSEVVTNLSTTYVGWRLATAEEVDGLWTGLFGALPEWNRWGPDIGLLQSDNHDEYFDSIFNVFGQVPDGTFTIFDENGELIDSWVAKALFAVFGDESGIHGLAGMYQPYDEIHQNEAIYLRGNFEDTTAWYSTFLVKETSVPEPSTLILMLFGMALLIAREILVKYRK